MVKKVLIQGANSLSLMVLSVQIGIALSLTLGALPSYAQENQPSPAPSTEELLTIPRTLQEAGLSQADILSQTPETTPLETAPPEAPTPSTSSPYAPISPQIGGSFSSGSGTGDDRAFMSLEGFMPLNQTPGRRLSYLQGRFNITPDGGHPSGNVMVGYRNFNDKTGNILGGYLGLDLRDTGRSSFTQLGLGLETVAPNWEARVNGYVPLGNQRQQVAESIVDTTSGTASTTTAFQGNYLLYTNTLPGGERRTTRVFDNSLGGFDLEGGVKLAGWNQGDLRGYVGTYYYGGPDVSAWGIRSRLAAKINDNLHSGLMVQNDPEFGTTAVVTVGVTFPGSRSRGTTPEQKNWSRMAESPNRQSQVAVTTKTQTEVVSLGPGGSSTFQAINPATGKPWFFQHVKAGTTGGDGTFESPFGQVDGGAVPTDGNGIIYVQAGDGTVLQGFTIPDKVQVLSSGISQQLSLPDGVVTLPLSGSGTLAKVGGTITMGNDTTLAGFNITGFAGNGIVGTGLRNVTIRDNTISNLTGTGNGIVLEGNLTGSLTVVRNTISSLSGLFSGVGINISSNQSTAQPLEVKISHNKINSTSFSGIVLNSSGNTTGIFTISNNTIESSSLSGINVKSGSTGQARFFIDSNQIKDVNLFFTSQQGITVSREGTGQVFASITNNNINIANSFSASRIEFRAFNYDSNPLCLRLRNNTAPNTGFLFYAPNGTFQLEPLSGNTGTVQPSSGNVQYVPEGTCGF